MNNIDKQYLNLCQDILKNGTKKQTRTGTDSISVFGRQIRHKMSDGFPLLTTKKMHWKSIVTELLWFLRGDTNIKFLLDNGCHIWDGDAYKNYVNKIKLQNNWEVTLRVMDINTIGQQELLSKEEFINKIKTDDEFAKKWGDLGSIYGKQWRKWHTGWDVVEDKNTESGVRRIECGIDQIANLTSELKTNPDSRRLMVSAWNVGELDQMVLPPCHYGFQVYTRELTFRERMLIMDSNSSKLVDDIEKGKFTVVDVKKESENYLNEKNIPTRTISLMWNQRSVDVPLGLPFNIASYGLLLEMLAKQVNMIPDELIGNLGDCHIYENQIEGIKEQLTREPFDLPSLNINTEWWPTIGGSCGEGPLDAIAVINGFKDENFCKCFMEDDLQLANYKSHPAIKMPLSN